MPLSIYQLRFKVGLQYLEAIRLEMCDVRVRFHVGNSPWGEEAPRQSPVNSSTVVYMHV